MRKETSVPSSVCSPVFCCFASLGRRLRKRCGLYLVGLQKTLGLRDGATAQTDAGRAMRGVLGKNEKMVKGDRSAGTLLWAVGGEGGNGG